MTNIQKVKAWLDEPVRLPKKQSRDASHVSMFAAGSKAQVKFAIVGGDFLSSEGTVGFLSEKSITMPVVQRRAYGWYMASLILGWFAPVGWAITNALTLDGQVYGFHDVASLDNLSETAHRRVGRGLAGAAIGTAVMGGAGAIAGAVVSSGDNTIINACLSFRDGKRALIRCSADDYAKLKFAIRV